MQFHSLESLDPRTVQVKLVPAKDTSWQPGQLARFAIPDQALGPNSGRSVIAASGLGEFFFEFYLVMDNSLFIQTLLELEEGSLVYVKLEEALYSLPEQGTWLITEDAIGVARAYAKKYQATSNEITLVLYQTGKTYFADITRVCGQNPQFTILTASNLAELAFRLQEARVPITLATTPSDATFLKKWLLDQGIPESDVQLLMIE